MKVAFDASFLVILFNPNSNASVARATERVGGLLEKLTNNKDKVVIPTPALAEILVSLGQGAVSYIETLKRFSCFQVRAFDGDYPAFEPDEVNIGRDPARLLPLIDGMAAKILDPQYTKWPDLLNARVARGLSEHRCFERIPASTGVDTVSHQARQRLIRLEMEQSDELHMRLAAAMDSVKNAIRAVDQAAKLRESVCNGEIDELRKLARDWQQQFHQLEAIVARLGYATGYGERGEVTIARSF